MRSCSRGFTLLELLVVVAVIAIMSGALVLSASGGGVERRLEDESARLLRVLQLLCDQSVIEARFIGFGVGTESYAGFDFTDSGWKVINNDGPLAVYQLPEQMQISVAKGADELASTIPDEPQFVCAPTGELGALDLSLGLGLHGSAWRIALDDDGIARSTLSDDQRQ